LGKRQSSLLKGLLPVPIKYEYSECNSLWILHHVSFVVL
jgi:hypothetical protein